MKTINYDEMLKRIEDNKGKKYVILGIVEEDREMYLSIHSVEYMKRIMSYIDYNHDLVGEIVYTEFVDENDNINGGTLEIVKKGFLEKKIKTFDNGRQVINMPNSINFLICFPKDKKVLMSKQFRASEGKDSINIFGGYIENNETVFDAMIREMQEETNISKEDILRIEKVYENKFLSMGYTTERNSLFIIAVNKSIDELDIKCNDTDENIEMVFYPLEEAITTLKNSTDGLKTFLALDKLRELV